jgi:hypothetical protein
MSTQIGYIDSDGHPRLTIRISGPDPTNFIQEDALIDTGFTGFLMLPQAKAFALGIAPSGTGDYTLADDSVVTNYLGTATVTIQLPSVPPATNNPAIQATVQPETISGVVVMCGNGALVGMELLRLLDKFLVVGPFVVLLDVTAVSAAATTATPPPRSP